MATIAFGKRGGYWFYKATKDYHAAAEPASVASICQYATYVFPKKFIFKINNGCSEETPPYPNE
ncbi:hypothetical protein ACQKNS_18785 [Peribacillus sp. NPDC094092]|uniref:hypothetical protein n=1 Tax=Peribacillus sp. NPDC094092 TaxID=3390611 RepID=UPI003D073471